MRCVIIVFYVTLLVLSPASAQTLGQGVERVAVDDGVRRICVNGAYDQVSVRLGRIVVEKTKTWLSEDTVVDLIIDGKIEKRDADYNRVKGEMPIRMSVNISKYDKGTIAVPVEISLLSKYPLTLKNHSTNLLELDFSFVNSSEDSSLTKIIKMLPDAARGLPLPTTPYTASFIQASTVVGNIIDSLTQDEENQENISREGRISLEFNETGQCGRNGAFTGTYVFIKSANYEDKSNSISLNDLKNYCFIKRQDASAIFYEKRDDNGICTYDVKNIVRLVNPHFTLVVSVPSSTFDGESNREVIESAMAVSMAERKDDKSIQLLGFVDEYNVEKLFYNFNLDRSRSLEDLTTKYFEVKDKKLIYKPDPNLVQDWTGVSGDYHSPKSIKVSKEDFGFESMVRNKSEFYSD